MEKLDPCELSMGVSNGAAAVENNTEILQKKLKIELPYDPAILLLSIHPKELKTISKRYLYTHVHCNIFHKGQEMEAT